MSVVLWSSWLFRLKLFALRFWQPTSACMTCMAGTLAETFSLGHWAVALQTGLVTGVLAMLLSFTRWGRLYGSRFGNAAVLGALTAVGDSYAHAGSPGFSWLEVLQTGVVSALITLVASYVVPVLRRRVMALWRRCRRAGPAG